MDINIEEYVTTLKATFGSTIADLMDENVRLRLQLAHALQPETPAPEPDEA